MERAGCPRDAAAYALGSGRYCELVAACNAEAERAGGESVITCKRSCRACRHSYAASRGMARSEPRGALYRRHAVFRPELDCLMFGRSAERFCRVCEHTIASRIEALLR